MKTKLYTGKEINELLGTSTNNWACKGKDLLNRAKSAGLIIEIAQSSPGLPNLYRIVENNFQLPNEEWRSSIFDDFHEVSNLGRYRQKANKRLVSGRQQPDGYIRVYYKSGKDNIGVALHRVVFFTFHPELFEHQNEIQIDHINGIRNDNVVENLRGLSAACNIGSKIENRDSLQYLLTKIILKYGYDTTREKLENLLEEKENDNE